MRTAPPQRMRVNCPPRTPFQFQEIYHGTHVMKHSHLGMIHKKYKLENQRFALQWILITLTSMMIMFYFYCYKTPFSSFIYCVM